MATTVMERSRLIIMQVNLTDRINRITFTCKKIKEIAVSNIKLIVKLLRTVSF